MVLSALESQLIFFFIDVEVLDGSSVCVILRVKYFYFSKRLYIPIHPEMKHADEKKKINK